MKKILSVIIMMLMLTSCQFNILLNYEMYDDSNFYYALSDVGQQFDNIDDLDIDWVDGSIEILLSDKYKYVTVFEKTNKNISLKHKCHVYQDNNKLNIRYCKSAISIPKSYKKVLTIYIPLNFMFDNVSLEFVSSSLSIDGLNANSLDIENVSGKVNIMKIDVLNVSYKGVSGSLFLSTTNDALNISIDQVSGNSIISLNENHPGFTLDFETISGSFTSSFETFIDDNQYVYNSKMFLSIVFESVSGTLLIGSEK